MLVVDLVEELLTELVVELVADLVIELVEELVAEHVEELVVTLTNNFLQHAVHSYDAPQQWIVLLKDFLVNEVAVTLFFKFLVQLLIFWAVLMITRLCLG